MNPRNGRDISGTHFAGRNTIIYSNLLIFLYRLHLRMITKYLSRLLFKRTSGLKIICLCKTKEDIPRKNKGEESFRSMLLHCPLTASSHEVLPRGNIQHWMSELYWIKSVRIPVDFYLCRYFFSILRNTKTLFHQTVLSYIVEFRMEIYNYMIISDNGGGSF